MSQSHIQEQIEQIARHEQEFLERRTTAERVIDSIAGFIGSLPFVAVHLCDELQQTIKENLPGS
jgi:uncharacterized membrane protein